MSDQNIPLYSVQLVYALLRARSIAPTYGADEIYPEHLLLGVFCPGESLHHTPSVQSVLELSSEFTNELIAIVQHSFSKGQSKAPSHGDLPLTEDSIVIVKRACAYAHGLGHTEVTMLHLIKSLADDASCGKILEALGLGMETIDLAFKALKG